jgi:hypothetical protein
MARQRRDRDGSWTLAEQMLERGDSAFVDEIRSIHDPARLGDFAPRWFSDTRPEARRLLLEYLDRPLNAYRHEPLVKRLFKLAEKAGDDVVMAHFLVLFDRSVRRTRRRRYRFDRATRQNWTEETIAVPRGTVMPRSDQALRYRQLEAAGREPLRLFSVHTRYYLRRRTWRYFRKLGMQHSDRYPAAAIEALARFTDDDVVDGLELLDNWGMVHLLFHECPALKARANGWTVARGHALAELTPAPAYAAVWQVSSEPLLDLLLRARCRPVRQWTIQMLQRHHPDALAQLPLSRLLALLAHEDPALAALAAEGLRKSPALAVLTLEQWLGLLDTANPLTLDVLCELMIARLDPATVTLAQAVRLAMSRPLPVAQLGLAWLRSKQPANVDDCRAILGLAEAEAAPIRAELIRWARSVLGASPEFQAAWVLELLDSRHVDVRMEAWAWFQAEPRAHNDVALWQRLLESPYDDLRLRLIGVLEDVVARGKALPIDASQLDPEMIRFLWASVLLNIHRGNRSKPFVVRQMVRRLERHPEEAARLLPILAVALRSVRGPEWRAGLAGVVQIVDRCPEVEPAVRSTFPELQLASQGSP